ncbi:MAG: ABC transporter ATP-binding protein [Candidatus Omnitrophica bacterium]|nr:ABC transporter ATP-binding protein [Candidatus Omnitrophota bacterium]
MNVIQLNDAWEMYRLKFVIEGRVSWDNFWALKGMTFNIEKGQAVGVIGENGAGKSTLLKLIAGMLKPDRGKVKVEGRVCGLLELGAGFQTELTGKENVYLNASLFGLTQAQTDEKFDQIVEFAALGRFIHAPVKCYSQGMFVRLAFAIAIHMDPDILLIDDTLAVGDEHFQNKCIKKVFELKEQGKTIIVVTHDMNILSRLCKRTILLKEGRLIKDDLTEKVVPLYSQLEGARESVGFLEAGPLRLIFNSGRLFMNWRDELLTPHSGAYSAFRIASRWYSSLQANWQVSKDGQKKLIAKGKFYQLALTQIWRLEIVDNAINWNIEMQWQEPLQIQEGHTNILLSNEYARWFTVGEKGDFPKIDNSAKEWQEMLNADVLRGCAGAQGKQNSVKKIPALVFEQSGQDSCWSAQILNTDYFTNCRVLQFRAWSLQNNSASCSDRFIYFSGRIIVNIPNVDSYLKKLVNRFSLTAGELKLNFEKGQGILSYGERILTKGTHINTSFYAQGKRYSSHFARWQAKKIGENKLVLRGRWSNLPLEQIWELEKVARDCFTWKVIMKIDRKIEVQEQRLQFMCTEAYGHYLSDYGSAGFSDKFLEGEMDMLQRCIPDGPIGLFAQGNQFPALLLEFSQGLGEFAKIVNSDFYHKARVLRIENIAEETQAKLLPGKHVCFKIKARIEKNMQVAGELSTNMLVSQDADFKFDKGKGSIYWQDREITKGIGLYTSVCSQGRWHDSYSKALWKIKAADRKQIMAMGRWLHLPISQIWEVTLSEDNVFELTVKMKVEKEIMVERLQTNLMLSERYSHWRADKLRGVFPAFKTGVKDDWDCIYPGTRELREIIAEAEDKNLPRIMLIPQMLNLDWSLNIVNSDAYHRGRILQYLDANKKMVLPGEYPYFRGRIYVKSNDK